MVLWIVRALKGVRVSADGKVVKIVYILLGIEVFCM